LKPERSFLMIHTNLYPSSALEKLELHKITGILEKKCKSELGLSFLRKMTVSSDYNFIIKALLQVNEFKTLIESDEPFHNDDFHDLKEELNYLEIENAVLSEEQFLMLLKFLQTIKSIHNYFAKRPGTYANLEALLRGDSFNDAALKSISSVISEEGQVKSGVSKELDKIRSEIRQIERQLEKKFQSILLQAQSSGWLASGAESFKNGRRVLTLHAEHKRKIKGIIHDESATGKTVYLEPEQTIELSNDQFDLKQQEKREIFRILKTLSDAVRPEIPLIRFYQKTAGLYDFIKAKASFAIDIKASMPDFQKKPIVKLHQANHPILWMHNREMDRKTVPLNVSLSETERILVISGPNAGGKSVSLKTIGLLQVMLQSGMLVSVHPDSKMGVFNKICIELGDEQSIENDLSTYSSHLTHMREFTNMADGETLFLIDEFGTGTDPMFGGAIAEAVLEELNNRECFGVVTTHYSNLKVFATHTKGIINGSMLFDMDSLNSLYMLKIGVAGSSHAFEIAQKIGLSQKVIDQARTKVDASYQNFDSLLATMETDKHWLEMKQKKLDTDQAALDSVLKSYTRLKEDLEKNKQQIMLDNKQKALEQLDKVNKKFENLFREINTAPEKKSDQKKVRQEIDKEKEILIGEVKEIRQKTEAEKKPTLELRVGAQVKVEDSKELGMVEEIRKGKALVAFKSLKTLIDIKKLEVVKLPEDNIIRRFANIDYSAVTKDFNPSIDVRGMRADEALSAVESQLDKAMLLNFSSLRILHGKGDGILRRAIREMLKKYDVVKEVKSENPDFGGEGITLVELK
jgi:DNA mismatch repair protein MutS2